MRTKRISRCRPLVAVLLLTLPTAATSRGYGRSQQTAESSNWSAAGDKEARKWRVVVTDPLLGSVTRKALDSAATWLESPSCASVLTDFNDPMGHSLAERLAPMEMDVRTYLTFVLFIDDTRSPSCREGVVAIAAPGSRVVRLCGDVFKRTWQQDPTYTVAALIHEMLHTLGLGENPPASSEITRRVLTRCRPGHQNTHHEP